MDERAHTGNPDERAARAADADIPDDLYEQYQDLLTGTVDAVPAAICSTVWSRPAKKGVRYGPSSGSTPLRPTSTSDTPWSCANWRSSSNSATPRS